MSAQATKGDKILFEERCIDCGNCLTVFDEEYARCLSCCNNRILRKQTRYGVTRWAVYSDPDFKNSLAGNFIMYLLGIDLPER